MKIKNQIKIFLSGMIAIPLLCLLGIPAIQYVQDQDRMLLQGYQQLRKAAKLELTEENIKNLEDLLLALPSHIEFALVSSQKGLIASRITGIQKEKITNFFEIYDFIEKTSHEYFYQIVRPHREKPNATENFILVSRVAIDRMPPSRRIDVNLCFLIAFIFAIETFAIILTVSISVTFSRSITVLEKNTKLIVDGKLDVEFDVPQKRSRDNELILLTRNLDKMRKTLKENQDRKAIFIMGISHDLRTPIAVIKGFAEAISDGIISSAEDLQKAVQTITLKTNQLETMVDSLINFVKLNNFDWQNQLEAQNFKDALLDFVQSAESTGKIFKRRTTFSINLSDETKIPFDKTLFYRAMENIFSNAIRYTKENDEIKILATEDREKILISIEDAGMGIDGADKTRVFDIFFRGTNSRRESGMGIGLAVVKTIVDTHGWQIDVESEKDRGSRFTITIPKPQKSFPENIIQKFIQK